MLFAGLAASGFMSPVIATLVVAAFFLVSAETYLATHARGVFKMAFFGVGPTELRIVLAAGAFALIGSPVVSAFGMVEVRLFDLGGIVGVCRDGDHLHHLQRVQERAAPSTWKKPPDPGGMAGHDGPSWMGRLYPIGATLAAARRDEHGPVRRHDGGHPATKDHAGLRSLRGRS